MTALEPPAPPLPFGVFDADAGCCESGAETFVAFEADDDAAWLWLDFAAECAPSVCELEELFLEPALCELRDISSGIPEDCDVGEQNVPF